MGLAKMHAQNTFPTARIYIECVRSALVSRRVATLFFFRFPYAYTLANIPFNSKMDFKNGGNIEDKTRGKRSK